MERKSRTVAHVITQSEPFGGAQRNTLVTLRGLIRDGYRAELMCGPGGRLIEEAKAAGVRVHVIEDLVRPVEPARDLRAFRRLHELFGAGKYEIVHTHSVKAGLLGRLAARLRRTPLVIHTIHGVPFPIDRSPRAKVYLAYERLLGSMTNRIVCVGSVLRQEVASWGIVPEEKLETIYSGIEFSSYVPTRSAGDMKRSLGIEAAWPIVGCVGRLAEAKAQQDLVQAVGLLREKYPRIRLLLVGEGALRPLLESQIREMRLSAHVLLLGERQDIPDFLNIFDVYAMSSRFEGIGRALTEAMYWGLPIVATPVNGVEEAIRHEETGLLAPPQDPGALALAIVRLVTDRELAEKLGANARRWARDVMDSDKMIAAIAALYETATSSRASRWPAWIWNRSPRAARTLVEGAPFANEPAAPASAEHPRAAADAGKTRAV